MKRIILFFALLFGLSLQISADESVDTLSADAAAADTVVRRTFFQRLGDYYRGTNRRPRRFDVVVLPGPHYSSTMGFGIGAAATGLYSCDPSDPTLPRSNAALKGGFTSKGQIKAIIDGTNIFPRERYRMDYRIAFCTFPTQFWGIGTASCRIDANETDYRLNYIDAQGRFLFRLAPKLYAGPYVRYRYMVARNVETFPEDSPAPGISLWQGQQLRQRGLTAGLSLTCDTRDNMLGATRGFFFRLDQTFTPAATAGGRGFATTQFEIDGYRRLWRGAVLAAQLCTELNYGKPAWCMLAQIDGTKRMRGYYEGRYRDKHCIDAQIELRQHIRKRHGVVAWIGGAEYFSRADALRWRDILPDGGFGYRWQCRPGMNIRIDYGFTRHGGTLLFNIAEAF